MLRDLWAVGKGALCCAATTLKKKSSVTLVENRIPVTDSKRGGNLVVSRGVPGLTCGPARHVCQPVKISMVGVAVFTWPHTIAPP